MEPKAPYAECEECPLKDEPHVLGRGPEQAKVVVVGEAPGRQEVRAGIPFIGKSGQLLDKVLRHYGIDRDDVYVTNTVLCRPPDNRTPTAKEIKHCRARLVDEIKQRRPTAVLALGAPASKTILNSRAGIKDLRLGGAKRSELIGGIPVVATFHPAAALRNPDVFPSIMSDVRKLQNPHISVEWEPTKIVEHEDAILGLRALEAQTKAPLCALDIETAPPFNRRDPKVLCIGVSDHPGSAIVYSQSVVNHPAFIAALNRAFKATRWVMQNGKYDIQYLWSLGVPNARVDEDTMLQHYTTDERKGTHALEQLGTEFLGAPNWKAEVRNVIDEDGQRVAIADLPPELRHRYCGTDTDITLRLHPILKADQESDDVLDVYNNLLIPGSDALARAEYHGIEVDQTAVELLDLELRGQLHDMEETISKWVANPRSPIQIKKAFSEIFSEDFESTKKISLENFIEKEPLSEASDFARAILNYREKHKEWSTYVNAMNKHLIDGRIYSSFLLHGTESGRLSSRKPNMQNIKHGRLREMFIASLGRQLLSFDYSAIELRLAAVLFKQLGDPWLWEQFVKGRKLHHEMASRLFGEPYTEIQYVKGKTTTFSILYDIHPPGLAARLRVSIPEAAKLIKGWRANVPGLERYWKATREEIKERAHLTSFYGRKRRFWLITNDNMQDVFREGYNFDIQSPASDITLRSLIRLDDRFRATSGVDINITVHDSLTLDVEDEYVEDVMIDVKKIMEDVPDWDIPMLVEAKAGRAWS